MLEIDELIALSLAAGSRPDWAQAAGGNTSVKGGGTLYVKASGCRLSEVGEARGWVSLDIEAGLAVLNDPRYDELPHAQQQDEAGKELARALSPDSPPGRASLEAEFHLLGKRVCLHLHIVEALAGLSLKDGKGWFSRALKDSGLAWAWVDYRPPGHSLAKLVQLALESGSETQIVLMKNHGVIAYADSVDEALALMRRLQDACIAALGPLEAPPLPVHPLPGASKNPWVSSLSAEGAPAWHPLCPDDAIYAGLEVQVVEALGEEKPKALAVKGRGVLIHAPDERSRHFVEEMLASSARAAALARRAGEIEPLTRTQCETLLGMDGEKYRQGLK